MRTRALLERIRRVPHFTTDALLAGALLAIDLTVAGLDVPQAPGSTATTVAILFLASVPIAWRRVRPVTVFALTLSALLLHEILGYPEAPMMGPFVAIYAVGAYARPPTSTIAAATGIGAYLAARIVNVIRFGQPVISLLPAAAIPVLLFVLGRSVRRTREYAGRLEEEAVLLEREREERERRAVEEERARIARELHDIVAHNVSTMVVQAGGARRVLARDPGRASEALHSVEESGRDSLVEMRRLLGVLRSDHEGNGPLEPRPGAERLEDVARKVREAGLEVDLTIEGERRPLPAGVGLAVYRIVQESLTNTLRHGRARRARVVVRYGRSEVELEITDDGRGAEATTARTDGRAQGLIGMRERATLLGGEFEAGPLPGGGFAVRARLPIEAASG